MYPAVIKASARSRAVGPYCQLSMHEEACGAYMRVKRKKKTMVVCRVAIAVKNKEARNKAKLLN